MASFFTFSQPIDIDIRLDPSTQSGQPRKLVELKPDPAAKDGSSKALVGGQGESCPVYFDGEGVVGQVRFSSFCRFLLLSGVVVGGFEEGWAVQESSREERDRLQLNQAN